MKVETTKNELGRDIAGEMGVVSTVAMKNPRFDALPPSSSVLRQHMLKKILYQYYFNVIVLKPSRLAVLSTSTKSRVSVSADNHL